MAKIRITAVSFLIWTPSLPENKNACLYLKYNYCIYIVAVKSRPGYGTAFQSVFFLFLVLVFLLLFLALFDLLDVI